MDIKVDKHNLSNKFRKFQNYFEVLKLFRAQSPCREPRLRLESSPRTALTGRNDNDRIQIFEDNKSNETSFSKNCKKSYTEITDESMELIKSAKKESARSVRGNSESSLSYIHSNMSKQKKFFGILRNIIKNKRIQIERNSTNFFFIKRQNIKMFYTIMKRKCFLKRSCTHIRR